MNSLRPSIFLVILVISMQQGVAQSVSPAPGNSTVCPGERITYTVNPNPGFSDCGSYTWSITNGSFSFGANPPVTTKTTSNNTVDVFWSDFAGDGTLTVTSTCSDGALSVGPLTYAIRSLAGRTPTNARASHTLSYCNTQTIALSVDVMFLENTGGPTGITQQRADGYEWNLPAGWTSGGFAGKVISSSEIINVVPDNGCRGGNVTVRAFVNCGIKMYSSSATINLNRPSPTLTISSPNYDGSSCGNTQLVNFSVTPVACASNYVWAFSGPNANTPSGWGPSPVSTGTNNFIAVQPSGTPADAGSVTVTVTLNCGTVLTSKKFDLIFNPPAISSPQAICYSGNSVTLTNVAPNALVNWNVGSHLTVASGQGTNNAVIRAATSTIKISSSISATVNCPVTILPKNVWVGRPQMVARLENGQLLSHSSSVYNNVCNYAYNQTEMDLSGSTSNIWQRTFANPTNTSWVQEGNDIYFYFWAVGQTATFKLTSSNSCGTNVFSFKFKSISCSSDPCDQYMVSPNPSSSEISIIAPNIPAPCDPLLVSSIVEERLEPQESHLSVESVELYDSEGQLVRAKKLNDRPKDTKLDVSDLRRGVYYLKVSDGEYTETHRIHVKD